MSNENAAEPESFCSRCRATKPATQFTRDRARPNGLDAWCRACWAAYTAARREARQATGFGAFTFGVEVELIGLSTHAAGEIVARVVGGTACFGEVRAPDGRVWKCVHDGSLTPAPNFELVTPILKSRDDVEILQAIVRALRAAGAYANASCGVHVHVGKVKPSAVKRLVKLVSTHDAVIESSLRIAPERRGRFCRAMSSWVVAALQGAGSKAAMAVAWYGSRQEVQEGSRRHYHPSRYHGINLHSYFTRGTVEFRWFNGTDHAGKIRAYVTLCLALAAAASKNERAIATETPSMPALLDALKVQDAVVRQHLGAA